MTGKQENVVGEREGEFAKPPLHAAHLSTAVQGSRLADSRAEKGVTQNLPDSLPDKICPAVCSATWCHWTWVLTELVFLPQAVMGMRRHETPERCSKLLKQMKWG